MSKERLVILGFGFGAFSLLKRLDARAYDVTVVSPRNHFVFTPLLPSTTVGTIEFRSISEPMRAARPGMRFCLATAAGLDAARRVLTCRGVVDGAAFEIPYDRLVIAVGAANNTFGIPGVAEHAHFLKELGDARDIRQHLIACLEGAGTPGLAPEERARLLHVVVVGGGPTGVEFAAELHDFVRDVRPQYGALLDEVRITLIEASADILNTFDAQLRAYTARRFLRQGIQVRTNQRVAAVEAKELLLAGGERVPYGLLLWSTGIGPRDFVRTLPFPKDQRGQLLTDAFLRVPEHERIHAIGDCANVEGKNYPATAQVAQGQGKYVAQSLNRIARGRAPAPFQYRNMGMLAYIGGRRALLEIPQAGIKDSGFRTWLFWRSAYLTKLVSFKNKVQVLFDWAKTAVFGRDISRF